LKGEAPIRARAAGKLASEIAAFDAAYGMPTARRFLSLDEIAVPAAERATLTQLGEWVAQIVRDGAC
ncbi:MAG: type I-E CRISPR-associated protein Cas7/Cse4/CasC, partial [Rhodocyclaceae bacterium]|nr:type I-E CRISPR-associated protein Cas7/Cse4/CasC [Rhodocyclaceae bacterium]